MDFDSNYSMTIDGEPVVSIRTLPVINPATEKVIADAPEADHDHLDMAVTAAKQAFSGWSALAWSERQTYIRAIGKAVDRHRESFMRLLTREQGKPRGGAEWEIDGTIMWCDEVAKQEIPLIRVENSKERSVEIRHTPIGVVGAITPWNYPVLLAIWKILPALLAGNTMVVKPSPYTPLTTLKLGELLRDVLPRGVLNILSGGNDVGQWLTTHPGIGKVSFTGSTETGKRVMENAAGSLKRVTLELGGNDAAIELADVEPKLVAQSVFWAAFQNSAQLCVAAKRMYVHESIYDEFAQELVGYARTIKMGDGSQPGVELGPVQNKMQFEKVKNLLAETREQGMRFLLGGEVPEDVGYFIPVTIVDNPPEESRVVTEEAFGPILPLLKFSDVDDVVRRANDTIYGLGGSVWSGDPAAARAVAERLETGTVWINEIHTFSPHAAFAGHKQSGIGVEHSLQGLMEFTNAQTIVTKKVSSIA
jgi:acyl-CoA reductase-like NAD-dependent aldehyde dehydrogenase